MVTSSTSARATPRSSSSSYVVVSSSGTPSSAREAVSSPDDSDDEIVYSISEAASLSSSISHLSVLSSSSESHVNDDDDFVVLSPPRYSDSFALSQSGSGVSTPSERSQCGSVRAQTPNVDSVSSRLAELTLDGQQSGAAPRTHESPHAPDAQPASPKKKSRRKKVASSAARAAESPQTPTASSTAPLPAVGVKSKPSPKALRRKKRKAAQKKATTNETAKSVSKNVDNETPPSLYHEAVEFISSFLSNPEARNDTVCRLTLLQSLIIELGLATTSLPRTLTAARAFLKSRAFLNIKEYMAVRGQGQAAVRKIMHPTRSALIKDIKKKGNKASLAWVKESGLQVLLVACYH